MFAAGRNAGPDPEHVVISKSELAERDKAKANEGKTSIKAPPGGGAGATAGRSYTLDEIDKMPTSEWLAIPKEQREKLLSSAHEKAGRR